MISEHNLKAAQYLNEAAKLLIPDQPYTYIELITAFKRGIATIKKPVHSIKREG